MTSTSISYLNDHEISLYYKLYDLKEHVSFTTKTTTEISLSGPKFSQQIERKKDNLDIVERLFALWDYLKSNNLVSTTRPNSIEEADEDNREFIYEKIVAHKLFFPKNKLTEFNGLEHLIVWVAEPDYNMLSKEPWTYSGTFLFLIETLYDKGEFRFNLSGCSALQAISNIVTGQPFYSKNQNEPLGRYNSQHPLEKLKSIGAIYIHKQEINTIYRRRYMTNEQCFDFGGYKYRCNDLLGYPLFIS